MPKSEHQRCKFSLKLNKYSKTFGLLALSLLFIACPKDTPQPNSRIANSDRPKEASRVVPSAVAFNGERAMEHVKKQVEIGPRISGSPELARTRDYILKSLKSFGVVVNTDEFTVTTPIGEKKMVNLTGEIPGESPDVVMIASHYESKFFKDMHFVGANDPATSVGTLLELARVLAASQQKPKLTYWLVFFDGEEAFCEEWEQCHNPNPADPKNPLPDNTYGSRHYVSTLSDKKELGRVRALILLDLMGAKKLELGRDTMSTRWLQDIVWRTAKEADYGNYFVERPEGVGGDDHEPFLRAGIDSLDLIQLTGYPHWHRADDTLDKVSAQSMKVVGDVVLASLPKIAERLAARPATAPSPAATTPENFGVR
ncbi:MAG TPA: M28 family peptidase [Pyrinomonadaceae bacterium]|nr:M28 family peptidase [Pyrinomonadaceae bacterium]